MDNIDYITLLQIEQGVRMYTARFSKGRDLLTWKSRFPLEKGDLVLAHYNGGKGLAVVIVEEDVTDDFEPFPDVQYTWIVAKLNVESLMELPNMDKATRKKIRLSSAIEQAKRAIGAQLDEVPILPPMEEDVR